MSGRIESATQCQRVRDWLKKHRRIDPLTAWRKLGIYRLGARWAKVALYVL
jgi:Helix-turn-helix domain